MMLVVDSDDEIFYYTAAGVTTFSTVSCKKCNMITRHTVHINTVQHSTRCAYLNYISASLNN